MLAGYLYLVNFAEDRIGKDDLRMYTPENERLEAKKSPVVKGRSSSKPPLLCSMLIFRGVFKAIFFE